MALDYTMTRDAVNAAVQSDLLNANRIGQSAAQFGYLGADAINEINNQGGLLQMINNNKYKRNKAKYDAIYQQGLKDNPWLEGDQTDNFWNEVDALNRDDLNSTTNKVITDSTMMPAESTGIGPYGGGGIPAYGDNAEYDYYAQKYGGAESATDKALASGFQLNLKKGPDGKYVYPPNAPKPGSGVIDPQRGGPMVGAPQDNYVVQPGDTSFDIKNKFDMTLQNLADQNFGGDLESTKSIYPGDTLKVNPINTALSNEQGIGTVSTAPPSNLQGVDSPGMPGNDQGTEELGRLKDVMQTNVGIRNRNVPGFENVDQFGTPDDPRFQTIRWPNEDEFVTDSIKNDLINYMDWGWHDSPRGSDEGSTNEQTGSPLMDFLNKGKGLFNKGKAALGLGKEDPYKDFEFDKSGRLISNSKFGGKTIEQLNLMFPNWQSDIKAGANKGFFDEEFSKFLPEARDSLLNNTTSY